MMKIKKPFYVGQRSDDGKYAFMSGERSGCLFDSDSKEVVRVFGYSSDAVCFVGNMIYAIELKGILHIYDIQTEEEIFTKKILKRGFYCESGLSVLKNVVHFIANDENNRYYYFRYNVATETLEGKECQTGSDILGSYDNKVLYSYVNPGGDNCFACIDEKGDELCSFKKEHSVEFYFCGGKLFSIHRNVILTENIDGTKVQSALVNDDFAEKICQSRDFDINGEYIGLLISEYPQSIVMCYNMKKNEFVYKETTAKRVYKVKVMKNGILYGGETSCFSERETWDDNIKK